MPVSWFAVAALAATALGATIALSALLPTEVPPPDSGWKTSRILRTLKFRTIKEPLSQSACGSVWVSVHAPAVRLADKSSLLDAIELNWNFNGCSSVPKQIGLFSARPKAWGKALVTYPVNSEEGYIVSQVPLSDTPLPGGWETGTGLPGPRCLWPWVGAGDDDILAFNCLKIQPTWMEDHADQLQSLRIGELAIPGAHNAGAWRFNTELSQATRDSFVLCQDRSIWAQLVFGIRYFDFRIAYYDFYPLEEDRYWLNHNLIRVRPLVPLLKEIRTFLDTTKEVVFLDAHHFPLGFYEADGSPVKAVHAGLLELVQRELGPHLASARDFATGVGTRGPLLSTLVNADKRLVFNYVDNAIVNDNNWLWPNLPHLWANTNNANNMLTYLDDAISNYPLPNARSPLYSAMAQTTPSVLDILLLRGSLRDSADEVNRVVTNRLATRWRMNANIVSTDFFLGSDVTDLAIAISVERSTRL